MRLLGRYGKTKTKHCLVEKVLKPIFFGENQKPKILCLGAHPDDIEIGCGGTILRLIEEAPDARFYWIVFSGNKKRREEAGQGADFFLKEVKSKKIDVEQFRESYFPFIGGRIKNFFEKLKMEFSPDLIFTHYSNDAHQDHRLISNLTWNTFRNQLILEYEIPKYEGDLGNPNLHVCLTEFQVTQKTSHICRIFQTQKGKQWFDEETFRSILRLRGVQCNSPSGLAEAFYCNKIVL
jgi:LmbE family N-acetylglucosaminyl deacetylase